MMRLTIEEALEKVGSYGRYQKLLNVIFCLVNIPVASQILMMTFAAITPTWKCKPNSSKCITNVGNGTFPVKDSRRCKLAPGSWVYTKSKNDFSIVTELGIDCEREWILELLSSIFFAGWGIGAIVLGFIGDRYGRKRLMYPCFAAFLAFGLLCSLVPNIYFIIFCRFMLGFFVHGTTTQAYILISEIVGSKQRPFACLVLFGFSTIAWCLLDLFAYFLQNWKLLNIVSTVPYVFIILFYKITPESFQWLQSEGREDEVIQILRNIGKWNNKPLLDEITIALPENATMNERTSLINLFRNQKFVVRSLQQGYLWLVTAMGYYGLYMASADLGGDLYSNFIYLNLVDIPGLIATIYLADRIGRKWPTLWSMFIGGAFCAGVGITPVREKVLRVVLGNLGKFFLCIAFDGIYTWSVELFPTEVRSVGMGFTAVAGRVGSTAAPWIAQGLKPIANWLPFVVLGVPPVVGFFVGYPLPETKAKNKVAMHPTKELESPGTENSAFENKTDYI